MSSAFDHQKFKAIQRQGRNSVAEGWNKVADAARKHTDAAGRISFTNEVIYVSAKR